MEAQLRSIAGVVEVGLFTNTADVVVLAAPSGCEIIRKEKMHDSDTFLNRYPHRGGQSTVWALSLAR